MGDFLDIPQQMYTQGCQAASIPLPTFPFCDLRHQGDILKEALPSYKSCLNYVTYNVIFSTMFLSKFMFFNSLAPTARGI